MGNTYRMTVEENIFYAKRNVVDSIWKEANIEGIDVTFPEAKSIFEGCAVAGLSIDDTIAVNNLKRAWRFLFEHIDAPVDLAFVSEMNKIVGEQIVVDAGTLRVHDVKIGGTSWKPQLPDYDAACSMIERAVAGKSGEDRALRMFCLLCRAQLFPDGNKRTAQLVANKLLIEDGAGVLAVPVEEKPKFEELLLGYYETNESENLRRFLTKTSVDGIKRI
jgi:Fic family protein